MSDHLSGTRALADPAIDLTDLYAFPSPSRPDKLVLVMNVFPNARPGAMFSDAASYRFRIRRAAVGVRRIDVSTEEYGVTCTFSAPVGTNGRLTQRGTCVLPNGGAVSFQVNDEHGGNGQGVHIYAGLRLDPFFMDVLKEVETRATRALSFASKGTNTLDGNDVLSIVLELDVATIFRPASSSIFAVAAETVTADPYPLRLERLGRPEVKNILLSDNGADRANSVVDLRDLYNQEDPFQPGTTYMKAYCARLDANLRFFDFLDGKLDWPTQPNGMHPLTELLLADFLVVDIAKPYAEDSYFEIERAVLEGRAHTTCGGRSLNDDVIDTLYTLLVNANRGRRVSDGVDHASIRASREFPYLAPPNDNPFERISAIPRVTSR